MSTCLVENKMTAVEHVVVVEFDDTIRTLKRKLCSYRQRAAIVVNGRGSVAGVITVKDLEFAAEDNFVSDWYKSPAYTIAPDEPIEKARQKLNQYGNHQLIVIDDRNKPLGILWDFDAILGCCDDDDSSTLNDAAKKK